MEYKKNHQINHDITVHSRLKSQKVQFTDAILFASKANIKGFFNELPLLHPYYLLQYFSILAHCGGNKADYIYLYI